MIQGSSFKSLFQPGTQHFRLSFLYTLLSSPFLYFILSLHAGLVTKVLGLMVASIFFFFLGFGVDRKLCFGHSLHLTGVC